MMTKNKMTTNDKCKIQKFIANARFCSRRQAEKYILMDKVTINENKANIGDYVFINKDVVKIFDKQIFIKYDYEYIMLYKPVGYITSMNDPYHKKNISLLIKNNISNRLLPIGRLDINSEGLLIMTNDYKIINRLTHPKYNINKTYYLWIKINENIDLIKKNIDMLKDIDSIDGKTIKKSKVEIVKIFDNSILISMIVTQGINRQIRKMCSMCNLFIIKLKRISMGKINLDKKLLPYEYRNLSTDELTYLKDLKNNMENPL